MQKYTNYCLITVTNLAQMPEADAYQSKPHNCSKHLKLIFIFTALEAVLFYVISYIMPFNFIQ